MKKPWLLIIAGIILVTLIGLWLYLFFGGDEAKQDLYNTFGLDGDELPFNLDELLPGDLASSTPAYLRQLTLRPVIGYVPMAVASNTPPTVHFAEAGTGHIYSVRVENGEEERLSNITIPSAREASFSPDGLYAAITSEDGRALTIMTLPNGSTTLASNRLDVSPISTIFTSNGTLLYAVREGQSVKGYAYSVADGTARLLFTVPFREAVVEWGSTEAGPHYTYPKTAEELEGYLYEIKNGILKRLPVSGFGLSIQTGGSWILYTKYENSVPNSYILGRERSEISLIPEKCAPKEAIFVCAVGEGEQNIGAWYRGEYNSSDALWYYIPEINYIGQVDNLGVTAGRPIDATDLIIKPGALYFINNIDGGLWVYERDFASVVIDN